MIREMMESGATIGSHSTTHPYPSQWKRYAQDSPEYAAQLKQEFPDSIDKIKAEADAREKAAAETNFSVTQTAQTTVAIICSKCHAHIPEGQKFCSECGTKVEIPETKQSTGSTAKVCPGCGAQVPDGRKFCGECGTKVDSGIQADPSHCQNCGAEIPRGRKFCGECGFQVS